MKLSKDNPLLTAYALGELAPVEAAEVEAAILADESLRAEVEAIRSLAGALEGQLLAEPMPHLSVLERARLQQRAEELDRAEVMRSMRSRRHLRWAAVAAAVLMAAGAAGVWVLLRPGEPAGTNIVKNEIIPAPPEPVPAPRLVPTPSPYDPYPTGTPTPYPGQTDFFEPSQPSIGSAVLPAAGKPEPLTRPSQADEPVDNPWIAAAGLQCSTFGLNIDDVSYQHVRQLILEESRFPEPSYVRIEEMVNYFQYDYPIPAAGDGAMSVHADLAQCPWSAGHVLLRVAIQARVGGQAGDGAAEIVARDARVSVSFDPAAVASWRLIGYDGAMSKRICQHGERIAAGRQATALYELVPAGNASEAGGGALAAGTVRLDYSQQDGLAQQITVGAAGPAGRFEDAPADFRFAAAVAGFGMVLKNSPHKGTCTVAAMLKQALSSLGDDQLGRRSRFAAMLREATALEPAER